MRIAIQAGLRAGDLVVGVNQRWASSVPELARGLRANGRVALNVLRGDFLLSIAVR